MNWFERTERNRKLLIRGTVVLCVAMLIVTARRDPVARDIFWHLQTGLDWIFHGLSPWIDRYSFTFEGHAIGSQPILFQGAVAWLVDKLGLEAGLHTFKFACFMAALGLTLLFLRTLRSPVFVYLLVLPLTVVLLQLRAITRPELVSYSFSIIAVMLYHRARGRISKKTMLPIALLLLIWSNYHTAVLGYIIFFGLFIDAAVLQLREHANRTAWLKWLVWGLALVGVGFLNRNLGHSVLSALRFAPEWRPLIQEYHSAAMYLQVEPMYGLLVIAAATMAMSIWRRKYGYLMVTAILVYYSLQMVRLVTPSGIIILCLFASLISEIDVKKWVAGASKAASSIIAVGIFSIFLGSLAYGVISARAFMVENRTSPLSRPESMVDYLAEQRSGGRILNEFSVGGYLIYRLHPSYKVYMDGRTNILYPLSFHMHYLRVLNDPAAMREEVEKYDIDYAVLQNDPRSFVTTHDSGLLKLDYVDYKYSLFVRDNPSFPTSGALLAYPTCWDANLQDLLEAEQAKAVVTLPGYSMLFPYLGKVLDYGNYPDKAEFLTNLRNSPIQETNIVKFAAHQALLNGVDQVALDLLVRYSSWDLGDYLAAAIANIRLEQFENAESLIDRATMIAWADVTQGQVGLLYRVLVELQANSALGQISEAYVMQQRENMLQMGLSVDELVLDPGLLCNQQKL